MLKRMLFVLLICTLLLFNASVTATPVKGIRSQTLPNSVISLVMPATSLWYFSKNPDVNDANNIKTLVETQFWEQAVDDFKIVGLLNELSNDKAHGHSIAEVPVPTSAWLYASGLGVYCVLRRRLHK
jgi:hypothetical protein